MAAEFQEGPPAFPPLLSGAKSAPAASAVASAAASAASATATEIQPTPAAVAAAAAATPATAATTVVRNIRDNTRVECYNIYITFIYIYILYNSIYYI